MTLIRNITGKIKRSTINYSIYSNCDELPMLKFVYALCREDVKQLIKDGNPPFEKLQQAWEQLYEQYLNLCSNEESANLYSLQLKIDQKNLFVEALTFVRDCIQSGYHIAGFSKKIADKLNRLMKIMKMAETFTLEPEHLATELQTLRILINETTLELNELHMEMKQMQKDTDGKKTEEDHFYQWAGIMSAYFKFNIQLSHITVTEFENYRKQYKRQTKMEMEAGRKRA